MPFASKIALPDLAAPSESSIGWAIAATALVLLALIALPCDHWIAAAADCRSIASLQAAVALIKPFGKADVLLLMLLLAGWAGLREKSWRSLLALLLVAVSVTLLKYSVPRVRPSGGNFSFPSGDVASVACLVPVLCGRGRAYLMALIGLVAIVAAERLLSAKHYPSDLLIGAAVGMVCGLGSRFLPDSGAKLPTWSFALGAATLLIVEAFGSKQMDEHGLFGHFIATYGGALAVAAVALSLHHRATMTATRFDQIRARWAMPIMLIAIGVAYLWLAGGSTLWDRDEPRYAQAAVEMARSGNWLYPTLQGELRPDKPILIYWLLAIATLCFGSSDVALRSVACFAVVATAAMIWSLAKKFGSERAGPWAIAVFATSPLVLVSGTAVTTDAVLMALVTAAMMLGLRLLERPSWPNTIAFGLVIAAAGLTKGPIGWALPILGTCGMAWFGREDRAVPLRALTVRLSTAVVFAIALFLAWGIPANQATHGEFARIGLGRHVMQRSLEPLESHGGNYFLFLPYYTLLLPAALFPWNLQLFGAISALRGKSRSLVFGWCIPMLFLMSLVATKLPHYILPIMPAVALAIGLTIDADYLQQRDLNWLRRGRWLCGGVGLALALVLLVAPWYSEKTTALRCPSFAAGSVVAVATMLAFVEHSRRNWKNSATIGLAGMIALMAIARWQLLPALETLKASPALAAMVREKAAGREIGIFAYAEPSLDFYLGVPVVHLSNVDALRGWLSADRSRIVIAPSDKVPDDIRKNLKRMAHASGFNYSRGRWVDLAAYGKRSEADKRVP